MLSAHEKGGLAWKGKIDDTSKPIQKFLKQTREAGS